MRLLQRPQLLLLLLFPLSFTTRCRSFLSYPYRKILSASFEKPPECLWSNEYNDDVHTEWPKWQRCYKMWLGAGHVGNDDSHSGDVDDGDNIPFLEIQKGSQLDEATEREILQSLEQNMPSELEIRMQIMYTICLLVYFYHTSFFFCEQLFL